MAIEPVKIPQNVDVEDHIIGPVTLRQLFLTLGGGGVSYAIFAIMKKAGALNIVTGILAWTPLILTVAFAFIKINGISLFHFTILLAEKSQMPPVRYWQVRQGVHIRPKGIVPKKAKEPDAKTSSQEQFNEISQLSNVLDSGPILSEEKSSTAKPEQAALATAAHTSTPPETHGQ